MTAIVGVLNKHAIAVAADSAETVGGGLKIYDKANKIFTLSKHHPIGIAIYNNAAFNSCVPWEIIIKMYRRQIADKSFGTVKECAINFFDYLEKYQSDYIEKEVLDAVTNDEIQDFWQKEIVTKLSHKKPGSLDIDSQDIDELEKRLTSYKNQAYAAPVIKQLEKVDLASFSECIRKRFLVPVLSQLTKVGGNKALFSSLIPESLFAIFTHQCINRPIFSGLAFFGYGENEIYPTLYEAKVFNSFVGTILWTENAFRQVQNLSPTAFIYPMAQTDVMQTYIEGISPQIEETFISITEDTMGLILKEMAKAIKPDNAALANTISNIDLAPFSQFLKKSISDFKAKATIGPLMNTVATMEKEDLAELAENLIYLTSLKRRITPYLESVGGPVDVAIVSKGDGFIWLKRKHYFDPELNKNYFSKYFKS